MESETFITVYLYNSIVALMRTPAIPEEGDPHGAASIFGRMMDRGVRIAYGSVRAMDRGIRIHGLPADIWAATKILFQTLRHPLLRNGEPMLEVALPVRGRYEWQEGHELITPNSGHTPRTCKFLS